MNRDEGDSDLPPVSTPALVVDLDVFEANVAAMAALLAGTGKTVRPHVKTHRTPDLLRRQLGGDAVGVTCATVGEAEAMVEAGSVDVLVANEVVEPAKLDRLAALARRARVTIAADHPGPVTLLSDAASRARSTVGVVIDVDILLHRCGVASAAEAVRLGRVVEGSPGLRLDGIMGYEGRLRPDVEDRARRIERAYEILSEVRAAFIRSGLPVAVVSAAGTSTLREAIGDPTVTEIQAGTYALMEPQLSPMGLPFRCAAVVRGTVISRHAGRAVLDVGRRAVGMEYGPPVVLGLEIGSIAINDEHAVLETADPPVIGTRVDLVPGQIRTTFNLYDHVWLSRGGVMVGRSPVSARGRSM